MRTLQATFLFVALVFHFCCDTCNTQLYINVRNQGGDILRETITSNTTEDVITLEFVRWDGTQVTQLIDFKNEVQVIKVLVLGEEERGQSQVQIMCFVTHFDRIDFISSDAMAKLRQKNPGTIRIAEEDKGHTNYTMDLFLDIMQSGVISKHVSDLCLEAGDSTFTSSEDVKFWAQRPGSTDGTLRIAVHNFTSAVPVPSSSDPLKIPIVIKCADTSNLWAPCTCSLELCIGWYPCGLKYCDTKGENKKPVSQYRCGIKTCKKCYKFSYYTKKKQNCLWDE
ncbi:out at first protein [Trichogramma pretiosum]|uniref:Out at first protein n=1 Tax=Trichogramma kaykai TaxID=54128 RepID=A0ABD2WI09_9HYME|nr:out at first protein [Trichogramma pretiosum]